MSKKRNRIGIRPLIYVDLDLDDKEIEMLENGRLLDDKIIATIECLVIQNNGTIHRKRVDDWDFESSEIVDEED